MSNAIKLDFTNIEIGTAQLTLQALLDSIRSVYVINRRYELLYLGTQYTEFTGLPGYVLMGHICYKALYQRDLPCPGCQAWKVFASGQGSRRVESRLAYPDESIDWEIRAIPVRSEEGEVIQVVLLEQDVSERGRLDAILAQYEKLAALGQITAGVAHEINNPLTAIIANAQLLQRELPPDHEGRESVDLITRAGTRAAQMVRNLLDFARREQYHSIPVDVNQTLRAAMSLAQHELVMHGIDLDFELDEHLPSIHGSPDRLQGVWLNLVLNAVDSMDKKPALLSIASRLNEEEVVVKITDNGRGIPAERLERIFEPFYTTKAPGRGTGLGLSVCQRVIQQHQGRILVESQLGKGSQFTVVLPV